MTRIGSIVVALVVVLASGVGAAVWLLTRDQPPQRPEISAYSYGTTVRVGPYFYCSVRIDDCQYPRNGGELAVNDRDPVQLSVPSSIGGAWWELLQDYDNPRDDDSIDFLPGSDRLAATIPTVGPHGGRLVGIAVRLKTLVEDTDTGDLYEAAHAEWSVATVWPA